MILIKKNPFNVPIVDFIEIYILYIRSVLELFAVGAAWEQMYLERVKGGTYTS